ncbi:MAG: TetR/AcrR family transcriptional regulator [Ruminococcaceae bacterium]|nr:TetR/AcrR family transcriptional regulator [Oscillospiraceae bacterium]
MYKQCKSNQSAERQAYIADCLQMLIREKSYDEISITELCQRSGVPRNTFYRYFADKESVLKYLFDQSMYTLLEKVMYAYESNQEMELVDGITCWLQYYRENDSLWDVFKESRHNILFGQLVRFYGKLSDSFYKLDFNNQHTKYLIFLAYGMQGILDVWKYSGYRQSEKELASQILNVLKTPMKDILATGARVEAVMSEVSNQDFFTE